MSLYDNDDGSARPSSANIGKGHVALILAETILHLLVEKNLLETEDAVWALQSTAEVSIALAEENGQPPEKTRAAIDALFQMMDSFAVDLAPDAQGRAGLSWERPTRRD